jgi:23S rRNA pseudouridine2605 synthase
MGTMRINQYIAQVLGISRRAADKEIESGNVQKNGARAGLGDQVGETDKVFYKGEPLVNTRLHGTTIMLNKPVGYVTSRKRDESGASTVMDLLPSELQHLKPVGRLDKESDGLLLLTDDGDLLYRSTHPKFQTEKEYLVTFETPLSDSEIALWKKGMKLIDGIARADNIVRMKKGFLITLHQGKNRQIRRMAGKTGNKVETLTRVRSGEYVLGTLPVGEWKKVEVKSAKKKSAPSSRSRAPRTFAASATVRSPRAPRTTRPQQKTKK